MKKKLPKAMLLLMFLVSFAAMGQKAQTKSWQEMMKDKNARLSDIQKAFYADPENPFGPQMKSARKETGEKDEDEGGGWELFKRYEAFAAPRTFPSGDRSLLARTPYEYQKYLNERAQLKQSINPALQANTWTYFNPSGVPQGGGAGRVNCITIDPANSSNLWLGAPDGGLWKSVNGGGSWTTSTDLFTDLGVSDIAISPASSLVIYAATGDRDGYNSGGAHVYTYGIMKSTDGGTTWANVFAQVVSSGNMISRILIDPSNTQNIYASGSFGIVKSTNGGTSWASVLSNGETIWSMEFKPGTSSTIYASGQNFYVSTNSGTTWPQVTSVLPGGVFRMSVGVSKANANYVYVLAADAAGSSLSGVYQSVNSGVSFTQKTAGSPNLMGFQQDGSDAAGQSFYTLSIGVSPTNVNEIMVGGVNLWRSTDGGSTWGSGSVSYWAANHTAANYVHADIHHILYLNGTTVLVGCDGGIFHTTNSTSNWSDLSSNLQIGQLYGLGMSTTSPSVVLSGWQDNGTNLMTTATSWSSPLGGDGMKCFIDYSNAQKMYGEQYNASFNSSTNGGLSWNSIGPNTTESSAWATPWKQDPTTPATIYGGLTNLWKSTNSGGSWTQLGTNPDQTTYMDEFAVAPSNSQIIFVTKSTGIYKSVNGGSTWSTISGLPSTDAATYIAFCPTNPNIVYITYSGYTAGSKVFVTSDGGATWTNYSTGLPNLPADCITYQKNAHGAVYVGMDVGVYYRDSTLTSWQPYSNGLPNVIVNQMEIYYPTGKIRAATYGRGIWEIPVYTPAALSAPTANFTASNTAVCAGKSVNFTDNSTGSPTSWSWTFPGGTPGSSVLASPTGIVFASSGTYTVSMTATNSIGNNTHTQVITVNANPAVTSSASVPAFCNGKTSSLSALGANTYSWSPSTGLSGTTGTPVTASPASSVTYTVTGTNAAGCTSTSLVALTVHANPAIPVVTEAGHLLSTSATGVTYQWYLNGTLIPGATSQTYTGTTFPANYTVVVTNPSGCSATSVLFAATGIQEEALTNSLSVFPNPNSGVFEMNFSSAAPADYVLNVYNAIGKRVLQQTLSNLNGNCHKTIELTGYGSGIYMLSLSNASQTAIRKIVIY